MVGRKRNGQFQRADGALTFTGNRKKNETTSMAKEEEDDGDDDDFTVQNKFVLCVHRPSNFQLETNASIL